MRADVRPYFDDIVLVGLHRPHAPPCGDHDTATMRSKDGRFELTVRIGEETQREYVKDDKTYVVRSAVLGDRLARHVRAH